MEDIGLTTLWTALLAAAMGGALALLGVFLTNWSNMERLKRQLEHEQRQQRSVLVRARGEELYELVVAWLGGFVRTCVSLSFVMQGKLTYNQHLDMINAGAKGDRGNFGRIEMLIDLYYPSTKGAYTKVLEEREKINELEGAHKKAYERGETEARRFLDPFIQHHQALQRAGDAFKSEVIESIRAIP